MSKLTKNRKLALEKLDKDQQYNLIDAAGLVKEMTTTKFDAAIDLDVRLGVDPRKVYHRLFCLQTIESYIFAESSG